MKRILPHLLRMFLTAAGIPFLLTSTSYSQYSNGNYFEIGYTTGAMVALTDIGGNLGRGTWFIKDYNIPTTKLAVGAYASAHPSEWLGFRAVVTYGNVYANDALIHPKGGLETARYNRNLDFRSQITEGYVAVELYPTVFLEDDPTSVAGRLRPYGFIGVGVFHFNPQGTYIDPNTGASTWVYLRPLHTEGEGFPEYPGRKEYSLTQLNIPMGVGVKYYFSNMVDLSFEVVYRHLFTDYLDDVSTTYIDPSLFYKYLPPAEATIAASVYNKSPLRGVPGSGYNVGDKRGDPYNNDAYFTTGFVLGVRLGTGREWRNSTHCPVIRF